MLPPRLLWDGDLSRAGSGMLLGSALCRGNRSLCSSYSEDDFPLSQLACFITDLMQEKTNCLTKGKRQIISQPLTGYFFSPL